MASKGVGVRKGPQAFQAAGHGHRHGESFDGQEKNRRATERSEKRLLRRSLQNRLKSPFFMTFEETFRIALFQFVSSTSNAGFGTAAIGDGTERVWSAGATLFACLGMLTGAAAGSMVSGLKLIRVITLIKGTFWHINRVFTPESAIRYLQLGERRLS